MSQFESFLEKKSRQTEENPFEAYEEQVNKQLQWSDKPEYYTPYTSEDMGELLDERMKNTTYQQRTEHYFRDHNYMLAKAKRYVAMSENIEATDNYSRVYTNRKASKRRDNAKNAANRFAKAWEEQLKQEEDRKRNRGPRTQYGEYELRAKVMSLRLDGMLYAAKAKARSDIHENYLKLRAQLSCYTILKDQAMYLLNGTDIGEEAQVEKFRSTIRSLEDKIKSIKRSIASTIPSAKTQWQQWIDMKGQGQAFRAQARRHGKNVSVQASEMAVCLNQCLGSMKETTYPCTVPLKDIYGAPITHGEEKKEMWNRGYQEALREKNLEKIVRFNLEAVKRFEDYPLPTREDLERKGTVPCFMENPSAFMEVVFYAAPFYREALKSNLNSHKWFKEYGKRNQKFVAKVELLCAVRESFQKELLEKHNLQIQQQEDKKETKVVAADTTQKKQLTDQKQQLTNQNQQPTDQKQQLTNQEQQTDRSLKDLYLSYNELPDGENAAFWMKKIEDENKNTERLDESEHRSESQDEDDSYVDELNKSFRVDEDEPDPSFPYCGYEEEDEEGKTGDIDITTSANLTNIKNEEEEQAGDITTSLNPINNLIEEEETGDSTTSLNLINNVIGERKEEDKKEDEKEENLNLINNVIEEDDNHIISVEAEDLYKRMPKSVSYQKDRKSEKRVFVTTKPKNLKHAIQLRKEISSTALEDDLKTRPDIKQLYEYYDRCVKDYLKTEKYEYHQDLLIRKKFKNPTLDETTRMRNNITEDGLKPEELPEELKEVYDYYDEIVQELKRTEGRLGTVTRHDRRQDVSPKAFLETDLGNTYEHQVKGSNDCWSCAGAGLLNHFTKRDKPMTQEQFRAFKPRFRSMQDMGLNPGVKEDQDNYTRRMNEINEFTVNNRKKDRRRSPMGNPFALSDLYLEECGKQKELKNTVVRKMEFMCNSAKNNIVDDPSLLHNMMQKFKETIREAINKKSAVVLLTGAHYITITGIKGDQLEVCDSGLSEIVDNTTYKVSSFFDKTNELYTLELTWLERIDDPEAIAGQYQNLSYDEKSSTFEGKTTKAAENIALYNGVEAWKTVDEKDEDIRFFYAEGIYLPKTFTKGLEKNVYQKASETSSMVPVDGGKKLSRTSKRVVDKPTGTKKTAPKKEEKKIQKSIIIEKTKETPKKGKTVGVDLHGDPSRENEEEYKRLQKTNPNLTRDGYRYYRRFRDSQKELNKTDWNDLLQNQLAAAEQAKVNLFKNPKNAAVSMAPSALLLDVWRKNDGTVKPEYESNAAWNEKWIRSWAPGKEKEREALVQEMLPQVINQFEAPTPDALAGGWIEEQLDSDYERFTGVIRRMSAMNGLMEEFPGLKESLEKDKPYLYVRLETAMAAAAYVENYMLLKYGFSPIDSANGCTVKAPLKQKMKGELKNQNKDLLNNYSQSYSKYLDREDEKKLKLKDYYITRAQLEKAGKRLEREAEQQLDKVYDEKELEREIRKDEEEKKERRIEQEKKLQLEQIKELGATEEILQKNAEIQKLLEQVQKDTEQDPKKKKPLAKEDFPSLKDLKDGWVEDMFWNHTRELIELLQNGKDEKDEGQRDAMYDLTTLICVEIGAKFGIHLARDGKSLKPIKAANNEAMKKYIEKTLTSAYGKSYSAYLGLDEKKVWEEYQNHKAKQNKNEIIVEPKGKKGSESKPVAKEKGKKDSKSKPVAKGKGKKDSKNEEKQNRIIVKEEEEENEEKKKSETSGMIVRKEAGLEELLTDKDIARLEKLNAEASEGAKFTGGTVFAMRALEESHFFGNAMQLKPIMGMMQARRIHRQGIDNTYRGALSPLIQSIRTKNEKNPGKLGFNEAWAESFLHLRSSNSVKREASINAQSKMIEENLGNIFNGFKLPKPDELRGNWFEATMKTDSFRLFEVLRKAQAVPRLVNLNETAREYCKKNQTFQKMVDACVLLDKYARAYLKLFLKIDIWEDTGLPKSPRELRRDEYFKLQRQLTELVNTEYTDAYNALSEEEIRDFAEAEEPEFRIPEEYKVYMRSSKEGNKNKGKI